MKWRVFATDFDGTIATDGMVDEATVAALKRLREADVIVFLVTGRELKDFDHAPEVLDLFDQVVAENGGLLYTPSTKEVKLLGGAPPPHFVEELNKRGVPLSVGHSIVATVEPHEKVVLDVIKELAVELQVIFNKGAVMILPPGVNKASGLAAAADIYGLTTQDCVGIGDAENDHTFLECCGLGIAVANALPALKERVHCVTRLNAGAGAAEAIDALLKGELDSIPEKVAEAKLADAQAAEHQPEAAA